MSSSLSLVILNSHCALTASGAKCDTNVNRRLACMLRNLEFRAPPPRSDARAQVDSCFRSLNLSMLEISPSQNRKCVDSAYLGKNAQDGD